MTTFYSDPDQIADAIIVRVGRKIVLALPLGLGKAVHIANALVSRALRDESLDLQILTALTLETPPLGSELEQRFLAPAAKCLLGDYPELSYATLLRAGALPPNIRVSEFFFLVGQWLNVKPAQQNYIPANYTHALSYILERGVNVVAQLVARQDRSGFRLDTSLAQRWGMAPRRLLCAAKQSAYRTGCSRSGGIHAANFSVSSNGDSVMPIVPSEQGWVNV